MSNPKKILLVTRPIAPPWDEASKNFAFYLAKSVANFDLNLLTNGLIAEIPNAQQKPIYTSNDFSYFQKLRLIKHLRKMKNDFDILHYIFTPTKQNSFLLKHFVNAGKKKTTKIIQTIATLREDLYSDSDLKDLMFGDLIITYSDYAKNKLASLGFKNVQRVYPGIDLQYYSAKPKNIEILQQLGITQEDFVVTYPGEYIRLGATDDIVRMITENVEVFREKKIKIFLACRLKNDSEAIKKRDAVLEELKKHNAMDVAIVADTFSDMSAIYNLSDIVIFPVQNMRGKFDVPLAAVEPMACEKPVIVSDLPILKEFANETNSVTIEKGNSQQLADAIFDLYNNPEKRATLGKGGRKFCEENFDIKKVASIYEKIYTEL
ncbi:MAG: glycosyltransferase family 4 protein [Candidatus Moranbacteria bacterium]|nr:glycosyltransferase family 4 protein [Candidatus Moranbacteria bacterium]